MSTLGDAGVGVLVLRIGVKPSCTCSAERLEINNGLVKKGVCTWTAVLRLCFMPKGG